MTRIAKVRAATVAMRSLGQMMVAIKVNRAQQNPRYTLNLQMIDAGITIPPIPSPVSTKKPQGQYKLSTLPIAGAPRSAVINMEETTKSFLL